MKSFNIIVAMDLERGIGKNGKLPWSIPSDLKNFKKLTTSPESGKKKNVLIMGRRTWESIPERARPFKGRINAVVSRDGSFDLPDGVLLFDNFNLALENFDKTGAMKGINEIFAIGGGEIYQEAVKNPNCKKIYCTHILSRFDCDTFFPEFKDKFELISESPKKSTESFKYYFAEYKNKK